MIERADLAALLSGPQESSALLAELRSELEDGDVLRVLDLLNQLPSAGSADTSAFEGLFEVIASPATVMTAPASERVWREAPGARMILDALGIELGDSGPFGEQLMQAWSDAARELLETWLRRAVAAGDRFSIPDLWLMGSATNHAAIWGLLAEFAIRDPGRTIERLDADGTWPERRRELS
jgi:hypothetical protein